ncbi:hypothetical protein Q9L58_009383 [Maublancomyces gigas]|uniref:Uncharacterized protein n=1 Tax=Discina gigas TaxID=1032678 RepID=A0ABR3G728_9PEZI
MPRKITKELLLSPTIQRHISELHYRNSRRHLPGLGELKRHKEEVAYQDARYTIFAYVSQALGQFKKPSATEAKVSKNAQKNSFLYTFRDFYRFITTHRLFPLLYVLIVIMTITPSSVAIYQNITPSQQSIWVCLCTATTIICDVLEMSVLSTTLIADANTARTVILYCLLPLMTVAKGIGKLAKSEANWTAVGEFLRELMLVIGRFFAVINSYPTWQLWTKPVNPYSENQLTAEEEIIVLGLAWDCCVARRD